MTGPQIAARVRTPGSALQRGAGVAGAILIAFVSVGAQSGQDADDGPGPGITTVTGNERLTWDQIAPSEPQLRTYRYVAYVDGSPRDQDLTGVSCTRTPVSSGGFVCSAPLPPLTPGRHDIAVSSYVNQVDRLAAYPSWPIRVYLAPGVGGAASRATVNDGFFNSSLVTSDSVQLHAAVVTTGLDDPTDLAALPDGRVLVAERGGGVRVVRDGRLVTSPALMLTDATTRKDGGLIALAADRDFETTRSVYALYTTESGLRLARFTESNDSLSSRAILLDGLPVSATSPMAILRMGPDGKLYLGLDDGGDARARDDLGSLSGKVMRVNKDGTTPTDDGAAAPIFAVGLGRPAAMEWSENGATLWLAQARSDTLDELRALPQASVVSRAATRKRIALPSGVDAAALALYRSSAIPDFRGNLFVADAASDSIMRVRFDREGALWETEQLFRGQLNSIRAISVAPDGSLYVSTAHTLIRIAAEGVR